MSAFTILERLPAALFWDWTQLLVLDVANQRRPESIAEDKLNKPWRPIPSGRIEANTARQLLLCSIPVSYILSTKVLGGEYEAATLYILNWIYNELGAESHWFLRNVLNAAGLTYLAAGPTAVLIRKSTRELEGVSIEWFLICLAILFTTIQVQDLRDQEGDSKRGRETMPLVVGDSVTRWLTAGAILSWSIIIPAYWRSSSLLCWAVSLFLGLLSIQRLLMYRTAQDDHITFKFWALWIIGLYALPALQAVYG